MKKYMLICAILGYLHIFDMCAKSFEECFNTGCTLFQSNDHLSAIQQFEECVSLNGQCYQAYYNLGLIHELKEEYTRALECYHKCLEICPSYTKPHINLATIYFKQNNYERAKFHYKKTLEVEPHNTNAHHHLGKIYFEETALDECMYHLEKAVAVDKNNPHLLLELANAKNVANYTEEALAIYYQIDALIPNNTSIIYNIAYTLKKLGQITKAMPYYKRVLALSPDHAEAHFSYGLALLMTGEWDLGWKEYNWRWVRDGKSTFPDFKRPEWDGSDLHGKTIYIRAEQGLGDTFQFIRYAKIAKQMGGRVIIAVQQPLLQYMKMLPYADMVISVQDMPPAFDVYAPMVSCPMILKTNLTNVPVEIPYLPVDDKLVDEWRVKLSPDKKFRIGICWQGNPNYSTHFLRMAVAAKSMALEYFVPLFNIPGTTFYCLQFKTGTEQLKKLAPGTPLVVFDDQFDVAHGSFMDSAAVLKNLDLVITVDTSMGHFAAGLGVKTWVLLPEPADWRWMLDCSDTPWYPNMKLFRQPTVGDWQSVIDTIAGELMTLLDTRP